MVDRLGPTVAQLAGIELFLDPPFDLRRARPGTLDRRVLDQSEVWVDAHGAVHALAAMSDAYRANVVAHLHVHAFWMWASAAFEELLTNPVGVHAAHREAGIPLTGEVDPHAWLEATPLVRALRQLTPGIAPPEVLTGWARQVHARSVRAGTDIWKVPGSVVSMPQDPARNWAQDMRRAEPCPGEAEDDSRREITEEGDHD